MLIFSAHFVDKLPYEGLRYNTSAKRYETVYTGNAVAPDVVVVGLNGKLTEGIDYTVKYSNNINYNAKGKPATVSVTGKGNYAGTKVLDYYILQADLGVAKEKGLLNIPDAQKAQIGKKASPVVIYNDYVLKASDMVLSDKTPIKADTKLSINGKGNFTGKIENLAVKAISAADAKACTVKVALKAEKHFYNGKPQALTYTTSSAKGELTVTAGASSTPLREGKDYLVKYSSNTSAGTAKFTVIGIGQYMGVASKAFKIQPDKSSTINAVLTKASSAIPYSPQGVKPGVSVTVTRSGKTETLMEGKDYKVSYANNKKVGEGKYNVVFIGNYKGHAPIKNKTFQISAASLKDAEIKLPDKVYSNSGKNLSVPYVFMDGVKLTSKDYTVKYYDGKNEISSKDKITLDGSAQSKVITVKIAGKGNYQEQEVSTSYRVVKTSTDVVNLSKAKIVAKAKDAKGKDVAVGTQEYSGEEIEPDIRVLVKTGKTWTEVPSSSYTVSYLNNVNKGKAAILVTGNGTSIEGIKASSFKIGSKNLGLFSFLSK